VKVAYGFDFVYTLFSNFAAAFKLVQDAADASMEAERAAMAATFDPGSLVEQSMQIREEVEEIYTDKKTEFDDKLQQVKFIYFSKEFQLTKS